MKKNLFLGLTLIITYSILLFPLGVNAEINSAEERIINVVSGTYKYDGKKYKVTDEYQAKVREYLDRPDINFTDEEVSEYISTFYNNLGTGIAEGYLEEVKSSNKNNNENDKDDDNNDDNNNENNSDNSDNNTSADQPSDNSVSEDEIVIEIDPNMNYTVSDNGTIEVEEKTEDSQAASLEELAEEYEVDIDKIQQLQEEIEEEQENVEVADPISEEEINAILANSTTTKFEVKETPKPELEETEEPQLQETPQPEEMEEDSSNAGIIFAIAAGVLAVGGAVFAFLRKRK